MAVNRDMVTPVQLAKRLGITALQFRRWLRAQKVAGNPILTGHAKHQRYQFTLDEGRQLAADYCAQRGVRLPVSRLMSRCTTTQRTARTTRISKVAPGPPKELGHQVKLKWCGQTVTTLEDLLCTGLLAVVVGINPAPVSVAAGHYWQGRSGKQLWKRLRYAGLLPADRDGLEDDDALAAGVGFTDVVKRPTANASQLTLGELRDGARQLERRLKAIGAPLVIFAFKQAATAVLGPFEGNGFLCELRIGRSQVFVMPGPYENRETSKMTLDALRQWVRDRR